MKKLILLPVIGWCLCACSCRTALPLDPNTMKPSTKCLPENFPGQAGGHSGK
jgi:hypothetical protein